MVISFRILLSGNQENLHFIEGESDFFVNASCDGRILNEAKTDDLPKSWRLFYSAVILALAMICFAKDVYAEGERSIVAFGDEITFGYGLDDISSKCCLDIAASKLGMVLRNYSANGQTSTELYKLISTANDSDIFVQDIKDASYVFINIGSNDLKDTLKDVAGSCFSLFLSGREDGFSDFENAMNRNPEKFGESIKTCRSNISGIINIIKKLNSSAQIVVLGVYNPYLGINISGVDIADIFGRYVKDMNTENKDAIKDGALFLDSDIKKAALTRAFEAYESYVKSPSSPNADILYNFCPNEQGHSLIAKGILSALESDGLWQNTPDKTLPENEKTRVIEPTVPVDETDSELEDEDYAPIVSGNVSAFKNAPILATIIVVTVTGIVLIMSSKKRKK